MKKTFILILILVLVTGTLFACKRKTVEYLNNNESSAEPSLNTPNSETVEKTPFEKNSAESTTDVITEDTMVDTYEPENTQDANTMTPWDSWFFEQIKNGNFTNNPVAPRD